MNFIYEGMSPEELAAKRAELESELMAAQFEHEFESVQMMHELRLKDIEKQIILENCSIEKVADLYANEEDLYTEAEGGILTKFFNWLSNIIKAIFGVTQTIKVDPAEKDETIELGVDVKALNAGSKSILQNLRDLTKIRDANGKLNLGAIVIDSIAAIGAVKGIGAFISAVKKKSTLTKGEAKTEADQLAKASADIRAELERINNTIKEDGEKNDTTQLTSLVKQLISLVKVIESAVNEIKEKIGMPDSKDESKPAESSGDGTKVEPTSDGGNNTGDAGKTDDKVDGKTDGKPSKEDEAKKKASAKGQITADDPSKSENERVQLIVNEALSHLNMDGNIARCSEADFKKHCIDRISLLKAMTNPDQHPEIAAKPDYVRVYLKAANRLKGIKNDPGDDGAGSFKQFTRLGKGDDPETEAKRNAREQAGWDESTNTITLSNDDKQKLLKYYDQYLRTNNPLPFGDRVLKGTDPTRICMLRTRDIISNAKAAKGAVSTKETQNVRERYHNEIKSALSIKKYHGKEVISVTKETYDKYVDDLRDKRNAIKSKNPKDPMVKELDEKIKICGEYKTKTDTAAKYDTTVAWSGSGGRGDYLGDKMSEKDAKHEARRILSEAPSSGGFGIDFENNRSSLSHSDYKKQIASYESQLKNAADGSDEAAKLKSILNMAKNMEAQLFSSNNEEVTKDVSGPSGKSYAPGDLLDFMKNVFDAAPPASVHKDNMDEVKTIKYTIKGDDEAKARKYYIGKNALTQIIADGNRDKKHPTVNAQMAMWARGRLDDLKPADYDEDEFEKAYATDYKSREEIRKATRAIFDQYRSTQATKYSGLTNALHDSDAKAAELQAKNEEKLAANNPSDNGKKKGKKKKKKKGAA